MARSEYDKIRDYCEFTDKPFCAKDVIAETGMKRSSVYYWLKDFEEFGILTKVDIPGSIIYYTRETQPAVTKKKALQYVKEFFSDPVNKLAYYFGYASIAALIAQCHAGMV